MITLVVTIILFILFLRVLALVFAAGLKILGWFLGAAGFLISIAVAVYFIGFLFDVLPILCLIGVFLIANKGR